MKPNTGPQLVGHIAETNGAVREPQRTMLDRQIEFIADKLAQVDVLEKKVAQMEGLVLQLADGLHAHRKNFAEVLEAVTMLRGSYGEAASALRSTVVQNSRIEEQIHRLSNHAQGTPTLEQYDALLADVTSMREEIAALRSLRRIA